ncbi:hypothetical protein [Brevibacillus halotolerans]|nr:hypothetical protein [Brevibacillus halotolerans]
MFGIGYIPIILPRIFHYMKPLTEVLGSEKYIAKIKESQEAN